MISKEALIKGIHPSIDIYGIYDYEKMRAMQAVGKSWPIKIEVIPLVEEGQPYIHISKHGKELDRRATGLVPMGKVYMRVISDEKDLTDFWITVEKFITKT